MLRTLTALSFILIYTCAAAADWPQFRGPNRDGISGETDWQTQWPAEGPKLVWKAAVGTGNSPVSIRKSLLYTMGHEGGKDSVTCLKADSGKEVWRHSYACELFDNMHEGGPASTPTVTDDSVFAMSRNGDVLCLDAQSGKVKWTLNVIKEFHAESPFFGYPTSPILCGNKLIVTVGAPGASTVALDASSGKTVWKSGDDPAGYASPVLFAEGKLAIFNGVALQILELESGKELVRFPWATPSPVSSHVNAASPLVSGSRVFISSSYGMGSAMIDFDLPPAGAGKAKALWQNPDFAMQYNSGVLHDGYIYGFHSEDTGDGGGTLCCVDAKTGAIKWSQANPPLGALIESAGKLIILSRRGELVLADAAPQGYKELCRVQVTGGTCRAEPVLCDGRIYIRTARGELRCLDVRK